MPLTPQGYFFRQDAAPPHYAKTLTDYLNQQFPDNWIGKGGPQEWPPTPPDLIPIDLFFWSYIKNTVCQTQLRDEAGVCRRLIAACESTKQEMLQTLGKM